MHLSRDEVRALDRRTIDEFGVPSIVLMENAGRRMAELLLQHGQESRFLICCGRGNNGGDGFVIARHLDNAGCAVKVVLFAEPTDLTPDAHTNYEIARRSGIDVACSPTESFEPEAFAETCGKADWIVDALFGSGLKGTLRSPFDEIVRTINAARKQVFAVDVPSGLDADTGEAHDPTIRATRTAVIVAPRPGFRKEPAREWIGNVDVVEIGVPRIALQQLRENRS